MKRDLYWIDDYYNGMLTLINGIIKDLWNLQEDDGIRSNIIVFGNGFMQNDENIIFDSRGECVCNNEVLDYLKELCIDIDEIYEDKNTYMKRKNLAENIFKFLYKKEDSDEDLNDYEFLRKYWTDINYREQNDCNEKMNNLIKRMNIDEDSVVGIDVMLWYNDIDFLREKNDICSMYLYNMLTKRGYKCFMYSGEAEGDEVKNGWCEIYKKKYNSDERIDIFLRSELMVKGEKNTIERIKELCTEE